MNKKIAHIVFSIHSGALKDNFLNRIVPFLLFWGVVISAVQCQIKNKETVVAVRDFGAIPDDGKDDANGIKAAVNHAQAQGIRKVTFEEGIYDFRNIPGWENGKEFIPVYYISLENIHDLELAGKTDEEGEPATKWLINNDLKELQPGILTINGGSDVALRNITIDMAPYYYSAGKVIAKQGDQVTVKILEGHPVVDGQRAFIMGTYDLDKRKIMIARITWDFDLPRWKVIGNDTSRLMTTTHKKLSEYAGLGDGVFWFQGNYTGGLIGLSMIENLLLENVFIWNGHGFPLQCRFNENVTYRKVKLYPPGNRIATTCRDGFKIYCTTGKVVMDGIHIEGCFGDDGQNIHGLWLTPKKVMGEKEMVVYYPIHKRPLKLLTPGKKIRLLNNDFQPAWESIIVTARKLEKEQQLIVFEDKLPAWLNDSTAVEATEWLPESLLIKNSVFRNTGRFGIMPNSSNTLIDSCLFEYNNAAIQMGGEWHYQWLESMHPQNVEIRNCTFRDNNLNLLYGGRQMRNAINLSTYSMPMKPRLMKNIRIHGNTFIDEGTCAVLKQCENAWFWNNKLINCKQDLVVEEKTTSNIWRTAPNPEAGIKPNQNLQY